MSAPAPGGGGPAAGGGKSLGRVKHATRLTNHALYSGRSNVKKPKSATTTTPATTHGGATHGGRPGASLPTSPAEIGMPGIPGLTAGGGFRNPLQHRNTHVDMNHIARKMAKLRDTGRNRDRGQSSNQLVNFYRNLGRY